MYAIVEILGQQYKVEAGRYIFVNRMNDVENGATVEFDNVLLIDNDGKINVGAPTVEGAKVVAEVMDQVRGDKVLVFKKKRRKGYRKLNGHRQDFTQVMIKSIEA
ncbi:50S ribosomal protein L21 [Gammaproteobacteria bacterium]|nr:50S ribosomal protein L21 [Gammaproteobacteria bacterium]